MDTDKSNDDDKESSWERTERYWVRWQKRENNFDASTYAMSQSKLLDNQKKHIWFEL